MTSLDSFKCKKTLKVGAKTYVYYSLPTAEKNGLKGISMGWQFRPAGLLTA